ncbi:hypothetical protein HPP92_020633 [Vanilla planifolia]|uniref:Uncharacterized protein n=1 Tax=Vanilla planifolia TaxID=51239 RepID=A0A835Q7M5_VANPL|nr:hypothetical protein HPP92_020633 [Vanilla planifolia]
MRNKQERRKLRPSFALGKSERYSNTLNRASHLPILPPSLKRRSKRKRCGLKRALHTLPKLVGSHGKQLPPVFFSSWFPPSKGAGARSFTRAVLAAGGSPGVFGPCCRRDSVGRGTARLRERDGYEKLPRNFLFSNPKFLKPRFHLNAEKTWTTMPNFTKLGVSTRE